MFRPSREDLSKRTSRPSSPKMRPLRRRLLNLVTDPRTFAPFSSVPPVLTRFPRGVLRFQDFVPPLSSEKRSELLDSQP